jgi:hypothetical protein
VVIADSQDRIISFDVRCMLKQVLLLLESVPTVSFYLLSRVHSSKGECTCSSVLSFLFSFPACVRTIANKTHTTTCGSFLSRSLQKLNFSCFFSQLRSWKRRETSLTFFLSLFSQTSQKKMMQYHLFFLSLSASLS